MTTRRFTLIALVVFALNLAAIILLFPTSTETNTVPGPAVTTTATAAVTAPGAVRTTRVVVTVTPPPVQITLPGGGRITVRPAPRTSTKTIVRTPRPPTRRPTPKPPKPTSVCDLFPLLCGLK